MTALFDLSSPKKELLGELLLTYIQQSTTAHQCQVCGAYQSDHTHEDCPVRLASEMLGELE